MKALAVVVAIVLMKARAVAWVEAVDIAPMKALVGTWVEVVGIVRMKVLDMEDPMATGLMMSLVTGAMTIEGHLLMSTVAMMALATEEGATEGTMEATAMEEVRMIPAPNMTFVASYKFLGSVTIPRFARHNMRSCSQYAWLFLLFTFLPNPQDCFSLKNSSRMPWIRWWVRVALTS